MLFRRFTRFTAGLLLALSPALAACGGGGGGGGSPGSGEDPSPPDPGFAATLDDFRDFETWQVLDYSVGATIDRLDGAHRSDDEAFSRIVRVNEPWDGDGPAPRGTILLLETFTWDGETKVYAPDEGIVALVKRGGDFDPEGGGWERFRLAPDLTAVLERGGSEVAGGSCASCHAGAAGAGGEDHVFPHPADWNPDAADFSGYASWLRIDSAGDFHPLLGGWHQYSGSDVRRLIYQRQEMARPDAALGGYPTGTVIVKSVEGNDRILEVTAMAKRGDGFDPPDGNWEWFNIDTSTFEIRTRGPNLVGGACSQCHEQAEEPGRGTDYVFRHPDAPFNR